MKIIIDGLWGLGKTTLCKDFASLGFLYLKEPNISEYKQESGQSLLDWFKDQYLEIAKKSENNENVVFERSALTNYFFVDHKDVAISQDIVDWFSRNKIVTIVFVSDILVEYVDHLEQLGHKILKRRFSEEDYEYYQQRMLVLYKKYSHDLHVVNFKVSFSEILQKLSSLERLSNSNFVS